MFNFGFCPEEGDGDFIYVDQIGFSTRAPWKRKVDVLGKKFPGDSKSSPTNDCCWLMSTYVCLTIAFIYGL